MLLGESTIEWELDSETQKITDNQSEKYYDIRKSYAFKLLGSPEYLSIFSYEDSRTNTFPRK